MSKLNKNWKEFLEEQTRDMDLDSFRLNDTLAPAIWLDSAQLKPSIASRLLVIAREFLQEIDIGIVVVQDITITGSLANFNWSKYSDIDLHIIVKYSSIDKNTNLVKEMFMNKIANWNRAHDIRINGHEVEIYVQDSEEPHHSTGVFSVLANEWLAYPVKFEYKVDFSNVEMKATKLMDMIDVADKLKSNNKFVEAYQFSKKLKKKIRKFRKCGLETGGEYSPENLAFKVIRRNGYMQKLNDIKNHSYDNMMSIGGNTTAVSEKLVKSWRNFVQNESKGPADSNNDGKISPSELYYHFDVDGDGEVTPDEYEKHIRFHMENPDILNLEPEEVRYMRELLV